MTNEVSRVTDVVNGIFNQMDSWPTAMLLFASLIVMAFACRSLQKFPNRYIPITLLGIGVALNMALGEMKPLYRSPLLVLACRGLFIGFVAIAVDAVIIKKLYKRFPFLTGRNGNGTTFFVKPDDDKTKL